MHETDRINEKITRIFQGRFRLISPLGEGGMGSVYLIETTDQFHLLRALKILKKAEYNKNLDIFAEIDALKKLNHPYIPKIVEVGNDEESVYIVQEYIKGESLRQIIARKKVADDEIIVLWMGDVADALCYLHEQKVIHRDIKPTNIMVTVDGEVKVIDFGLARNLEGIDAVDECVIGTRNYTPPERYERLPADIRTDIYGFGTTFYYLATGVLPLEMSSDSKRNMKVMRRKLESIQSPGIQNILKKCIDVNPDKRYQNFNEIRYQIREIDAYNQAIIYAGKKRKAWIFAIIGLFLVSFICVGTGVWRLNIEKKEQYESFIKAGEEALSKNDVINAEENYEAAIDLNKNTWVGYQGLYETYTVKQDYEKMIKEIQELFENKPKSKESAPLLYLLGNAYYENGDFNQAEPYLKEAVNLEGTIENHLVLGLNYCAKEEYDQAKTVIEELKAEGGDADTANYLSGQISERQGNKEEAIGAYTQVVNSTKDRTLKQRSVVALGKIYRGLENFTDEIRILEEAKSNGDFENDIQVNELLGEAYYYMAKNNDSSYYPKAVELFNKLIDSGYERAYLYRNLAIVHQEQKEYEKALNVLDKMSNQYPDDYKADIQKAWIQLEIEGNKEQKDRDYQKFKQTYDEILNKAKDNQSDGEIQMLKSKYQELQNKGWL